MNSNSRDKVFEGLAKEASLYVEKNRDIFGDHIELSILSHNGKVEDLAQHIDIMIRGVNFSSFNVYLDDTDIKNMLLKSVETGLTTAILDSLINFDAEDDFYMNTYPTLDDYWDDFEHEELMDMVLEDEEVFSSIISDLVIRYD